MTDALKRVVSQRPVAVTAALVLLHLLVGGLAFHPAPHTGGDNTAYLALARSLLEHGRYLELWEPTRPPHTQYPPGFPALLAVAWTLGVRSWAALKLVMLGVSAGAVGLSHLWLRERVGPAMALALGTLLAVAPGLVSESQWVLSDVPFWAATMAALLALARGRDALGIGLAFAALTIRMAGLPLLLAIVVWLALRRRWKAMGVTAAALAVVVLAWTLRSPAMETPYIAQFWLENPYAPELGRVGVAGLAERVLENLDRYGFSILMRTLAGGVGLVGAAGGAILLAAAAGGLGRRALGTAPEAARDRPLVELFAGLYAGMLLLWPEQWASDRFLIPFLPVLLAYAAEAAAVIPGVRVRRYVRIGGLVALLALAAPMAADTWAGAAECRERARTDGALACVAPDERAFLELARWSEGRLPEDAVVVSRKPRQWYWHSGYPGRVYPFTRDRAALLAVASETGARYVVLDELGTTADLYLLPAVREHRRRFCRVERRVEAGHVASLLGVLPVAWDPDVMGLDDAPRAELMLPPCPPAYRPGDRVRGER